MKAGTAGGTAGGDRLTDIHIGPGIQARDYNFGFDRPPTFSSIAVDQVQVGKPYSYTATAADPDADTLTYNKLLGPAGLNVTSTGQVTWTPGSGDLGTQSVRLQVSDNRGGVAVQDFTITVLPDTANRAPHYTTNPIVDAYVGTPYSYPSAAADPDGDTLHFTLTSGPLGLAYSSTGMVAWTPTASQLGLNHVAIKVDDGRGGYATQLYDVMVHPQDSGYIKIISTPTTSYAFPQWVDGATSIVNYATIRDVPQTFPDVQQGTGDMGIVAGLVNPLLGLLQVAAGNSGLPLPGIVDNNYGHTSNPAGWNTSASFTSTGPNWITDYGGHSGSQLVSSGSGGGGVPHVGANVATWQLTSLPAGDYVVQATWHNATTLATNAMFTITDGGGPLTTATVNQTVAPSGTSYESAPFQTLATVHVASGTLAVVLTDNANGAVAADAIRVVQAADLAWSSLTSPASASAGSTITLPRTYTIAGMAAPTGLRIAYYASPNSSLGQGGDLFLGSEVLTGAADLSTGPHAGTSPVLQVPATAGAYHVFAVVDAAGQVYEADETNNVAAASQTLTVTGPTSFTPTFVDDAGSGFSTTGSGWSTTTSGGYGTSYRKTGSGGTGLNTATWQLTGLAPGDYQVQATWIAAAGQATNAGFTLKDGGTSIQTVSVDETKNPIGVSYGGNVYTSGRPFQTLATIHVTSGTLGVVLTDLANGPVVADAIRVSRVQPIDLNWVGGGVSGPTALAPGASFNIERNYTITGQAATADFTIAYYASTKATPGGGADFLLGSETIFAAADKSVGSHDGYSPTLTLPATGSTYYIYAVINAGGSVIENDGTNDVGMVPGRTPTYSGTGSIIHSPQTFYAWYHDVPGTNLSTEFPLVMTRDANDPTLYTFNSPAFFPIDGQLFGNDNPAFPDHNFNFTAEFHGSFVYRGGEQLSISSDDDSWVFINNRLVIDAGGLHGSGGGMVYIDQLNRPTYTGGAAPLNLVVGQTYPIDIFYAERATPYATFKVQTNLQLMPEAPYTYQVQAVDSDGGAITYALLKGPLGMTINPTTGLVYWQPGRDQVGTHTVTVQAIDATGITDTQTYTLTVSLSAGSTLQFTSSSPTVVNAGDSYNYKPVVSAPAGDPVYFTLVSGPNISPTDKMTVNLLTGELNWTPQPGDFGQSFLVSLKVTDNQGGSAVQQFNLKVGADANHAPKFTSSVIASGEAGKLYEYLPTATDQDHDALSFDLPVHPAGMIVNPYTGQIDWVPTREQAGTQDVILRVQDGRGGVDLQVFTIKVDPADLPPTIASVPGGKPQVGLPYEYAVIAQDPDNDPLTYSVSVLPAGAAMAFDSTRKNVLIWTPSSTNPVTVTVTVSDGRGWTASQTFNLTAVAPQTDQRPTITSTPRDSIALGLTYIYQVIANDPDGDHLTYVLDTPLDGLTLDSATGLLTWKPTSAQLGLHSLQLHVDDGRTQSLPQAFTVTVGLSPVNGAPRITSTPRLTGVANRLYAYDATATDPDNDTLAWKLIQAPAGLSINAATGTLRWLPGTAQVGTYPVTVQVADPYGGTALQPFTITVRGTNTPPVINSTPPATGGTASAYSYSVQATDSDNDPLTYSLMGTFPVGLQFSTTTPNLLQWASPAPGTYSLEILVSDGFGGITLQDWTLTVSTGPVDRPPTITSTPSLQDAVGRPYLYAATATDPDAGDTVTFSLAAGAPSWLSMTTAGVLSGTPTAAGSYPLTVIADDNHGGTYYQSFSIAVTTNHSPTISSNAITSVAAGSIYEYAVVASDPDNDPLAYSLVYILPSGVAAGTPGPAIDQRGRVTWAPGAALKNTSWPVTVTVTDVYGATYGQAYFLAVQGDVTAPSVVVTASAFQVNKGQSVIFTVRATDDIAVASLGLTVAGQAVTLDGRGMATVTLNTAGTITAIGTATDASGNPGTSQPLYVAVIDTSVTVVPTALITGQASTDTAYNAINATTGMPVFNGVAVAPGTSVTSTITVNDPAKIQSLTATLGLSASSLAGLSATLTSPAGTTVTLFSGLTGANLTNTTFDDAAATAITAGTGPYTGRFKPIQALAVLAGQGATGTYTLKIINASASTTATLSGWSLNYRKAVDATVTAPVDIIGTASDSLGLASYSLSVAPEGSSVFTPVGTGTTQVVAGVLGRLDPTLLANGLYTLRLTASNTSGRSTTFDQEISVDGGLKLGNFRQTFTDLTVNVAGIPIVVSRTYDTLDANTTGDFGYGWHLDVGDAKLKVSLTGVDSLGWNGYPPFKDQARVYITLPGGKPQGFTFQPYPKSLDSIGILTYWHPYFVADAGNTMTLTVKDAFLTRDDNTGEYYSITDSGLATYSPADINYGGYFALTDFDGTVYKVDATTGKLQTITDLNGNTLTFTDSGVTNQYGVGITYTRDSGRITVVTDPLGNQIKYAYDAYGDLISVTDQMTNKTQFVYNTAAVLGQPNARPHYLQQVIDPLMRVGTKAVYGDDGRLQYVYDVNGKAVQTSYGPDQHAEVVTDKLGHVSVFVTDDLGNVVQQTRYLDDGTPVTSKWSYNGNLMMSSTDALGNVTTYGYDAFGDRTSVTLPYEVGADPKEFTTRFIYNRLGEVTQSLYPDGSGVINTYDSQGNELSKTDMEGHTLHSATYGPGGLVLTESGPQGTSVYGYDDKGHLKTMNDDGVVTTLTYDDAGNILTTFCGGTATTSTYDAAGRMKHEEITGGVTVDYGYDYRKDWTSINVSTIGPIQRHLDADGRVTEWDTTSSTITYTYDANGQLKSEKDANGTEINYGYDALGRQTSMVNASTGVATTTIYDLAGRVASQTQGGVTTTYTYYPDGRQKTATVGVRTWSYTYTSTSMTVTDPLGHSTTTASSADGLSTKVTTAGGRASKTTYLYAGEDTQDMPTSVVDAEGHRRSYGYDGDGNLTSTTDLAGVASTITYDASGIHLTGPTGLTLSFASDDNGRTTSFTYADGTKTSFTYDGDSSDPKTVTLPSGNVITSGYNSDGSLASRDTTTGEHATFGYTDGVLTSATDATGTTRYTYDYFGNLASVIQPSGAEVDYHRDQYGRLDKVTTRASAGGTAYVTLYHYDASGYLDRVTDPFNGVTSYTYDGAGRLGTRTLPNGVVTTYGYDVDDRLTSVVHKKADGTVLASYVYTRAGDGEPTRIDREDGSYVLLGYDAALRLNSEQYFDASGILQQSLSYTYDRAGNRTVKADAGGTHNYAYIGDKLNYVTNTQNGTYDSYGHDANGNVSSIARDGTSLSLGYDSQGHVTSVSGSSAGSITYTYDSAGRRVAASDNLDGSRRYLTAPTTGEGLDSPYLATDGSGNLDAGYVYVGSTPLMRFTASGQPIYYLEDAMDSVVSLADAGGNAVAKFEYDSFGNIRSATGSAAVAPSGVGGDFRFQGAWLDRATSLYNMRARTYDPKSGLFLSRDPKQPSLYIPEEQNLFTFANNNPRLYADPTGQFELIEVQVSISTGDFVDGLKAYAENEVRRRIEEKLAEGVADFTFNILKKLAPDIENILADVFNKFTSALDGGINFGNLMARSMFTDFGRPSFVWLAPNIPINGDPIWPGANPSKSKTLSDFLNDLAFAEVHLFNVARPDFILGPYSPTSMTPKGNWLIGDFKLHVRTITDAYTKGTKKFKRLQYFAMRNYTTKYDELPVELYIAADRNEDIDVTRGRIAKFAASAFKDRFLPFILVLRGKITAD